MLDFVKENLIYHVICGSVSYGLNTPESDVDKKGVTITPKEYFYGLKTFEQQEYGADEVIYSLHKFVRLAFDANPNILEILYTDPKNILFINKYGKKLRENRHLFLTTRVRHSFGGYSHAQLKRIRGHRKWIMFDQKEPKPEDFICIKTRPDSKNKMISYGHFKEQEYKTALKKYNQYLAWKKNRNPKRAKLEEKYNYDSIHATHLVRLSKMCKEILETGEVRVLRPDREELLAIRNGEWSYEKLIAYAEDREKQLDNLYDKSPLPKKPNYKAINNLLIEITGDFLNER